MASAPINKVQDKNGDQFFPITHQQAVINDDGDNLVTILGGKQPLDADLTAIAAIPAASIGVLKKTGVGTWAIDTATFYTSENSNKQSENWTCANLDAFTSVKIYTRSSSPGVLEISSAAGNGDAGYIHFSSTQNMNGFRIASEGDGWASRQRLVFYRSDNTTSPYGFTPTEIMRLSTDGNVAVTGNISATGTITPGSDSRIKDNQEAIDPEAAMDTISRLTPKTWEWNEKAVGCVGEKAAGLIAQEVAEIVPEAVIIHDTTEIKDFHSLNYNTIQGYELAAIKGLIEEVKTLREELAKLKKMK